MRERHWWKVLALTSRKSLVCRGGGTVEALRKSGMSPDSWFPRTSNARSSRAVGPEYMLRKYTVLLPLKMPDLAKSPGIPPVRLLKLALKCTRPGKKGADAFDPPVRGPLRRHRAHPDQLVHIVRQDWACHC